MTKADCVRCKDLGRVPMLSAFGKRLKRCALRLDALPRIEYCSSKIVCRYCVDLTCGSALSYQI